MPKPDSGRSRVSAAEVLTPVLAAQVTDLRAWEAGVRLDQPEATHGFRVAARRLRSLLAAFGPLMDQGVADELGGQLKRAAAAVSGARDAEIVQARVEALLRDEPEETDVAGTRERLTRLLEEAYRPAGRRPWTTSTARSTTRSSVASRPSSTCLRGRTPRRAVPRRCCGRCCARSGHAFRKRDPPRARPGGRGGAGRADARRAQDGEAGPLRLRGAGAAVRPQGEADGQGRGAGAGGARRPPGLRAHPARARRGRASRRSGTARTRSCSGGCRPARRRRGPDLRDEIRPAGARRRPAVAASLARLAPGSGAGRISCVRDDLPVPRDGHHEVMSRPPPPARSGRFPGG